MSIGTIPADNGPNLINIEAFLVEKGALLDEKGAILIVKCSFLTKNNPF